MDGGETARKTKICDFVFERALFSKSLATCSSSAPQQKNGRDVRNFRTLRHFWIVPFPF